MVTTIKKIAETPAIMAHLRFDLTAEKLAKTKFDREDAGVYFCIMVRKKRVCLGTLHYHTHGTATEDYVSDFPEDMIFEALREAGGDQNRNGYYPINKPIEKLIRMGLYAKAKAGDAPLSKMRVRQLLDLLMELLHQAHGGDYYTRFNQIARERGRRVESSHFSKMDTVSMQLLIETIVKLKGDAEKAKALIESVISVISQPVFIAECAIDEKVRDYQLSKLTEAAALLQGGAAGTQGGIATKIDDIKDPALKKLFEEVRHHSATIGEDAGDALENSSNDEELIANWQSYLESLREEIQHFWGELEAMKSKVEPKNVTPAEKLDLTGWSVSYLKEGS